MTFPFMQNRRDHATKHEHNEIISHFCRQPYIDNLFNLLQCERQRLFDISTVDWTEQKDN